MADASYRIYPAWKDLLVYDEGEGRELRLDCDGVEPWYQVTVPTEGRWVEKTPAWVHGRRPEILARLRAARCVICEMDYFVTSIFSPDGTCRVEIACQPDDRGWPMRSIKVIASSGNQVLATVDGAYPDGRVDFPREGVVIVPFKLKGACHQVGVNVAARTFWFHPMEERPLSEFGAVLKAITPEEVPNSASLPASRPVSPGKSLVILLLCMLFDVTGLWQAITGKTTPDRWLGAVCLLFFGACTLMPIAELRQWKTQRRIRR